MPCCCLQRKGLASVKEDVSVSLIVIKSHL
jgi:hypothetical protein